MPELYGKSIRMPRLSPGLNGHKDQITLLLPEVGAGNYYAIPACEDIVSTTDIVDKRTSLALSIL